MQNYNVVTGERTDGMSPEEAQKKREDRAKDLPFSKGLEGGTQASILAVCAKLVCSCHTECKNAPSLTDGA